jgi:hypothetical protein
MLTLICFGFCMATKDSNYGGLFITAIIDTVQLSIGYHIGKRS